MSDYEDSYNECEDEYSQHEIGEPYTQHYMQQEEEDAELNSGEGFVEEAPEDEKDDEDAIEEQPRHCTSDSLIFDFRKGELPKGIEVVGTYKFCTNPDGSTHLELGPESYLNVETSFKTKGNEQFLNAYTIFADLRLDRLPNESMSLFQTQGVIQPTDGEALIDHTGGVGMFGMYGRQGEGIKPHRWTRVAVTYGPSNNPSLDIYLNGKRHESIRKPIFQRKDGRFAMLPIGFRMFYSQKAKFMPGGVKIKYLEVAPQHLDANMVKTHSQRNRNQGFWDAEEKKQEQIRKSNLSFFPAYAKKTMPAWQHPTFLGFFADAHASNVANCDAKSAAIGLNLILSDFLRNQTNAVLTQLDQREISVLSSISGSLAKTIEITKRMAIIRGPAGIPPFIKKVVDAIAALKEGDSVILPSYLAIVGRGNAPLAYVVERTSADRYSLTISNLTLGFGLEYHPNQPIASGAELEYMISVPIENIPEDRIVNDVFWMGIYALGLAPTRDTTSPAPLYEKILSLLSETPFETSIATAMKEQAETKSALCPFRPLPRGMGLAQFTLQLESIAYLMRRASFSEDKVALVLLGLQMQLLEMARNDLFKVNELADADVRLLQIATEVLSHEGAQFSEKYRHIANPAMLFSFLRLVEVAKARTEALPCSDDLTKPLPSPLELHDKGMSKRFPHSDFTLFDRFRREDVDGLAGPPIGRAKYLPVDFTQVMRKVSTLDQVVDTLRYVDKLCTLISVQTHYIKNPAFLKVALLEHTFAQVIPLPRPQVSTEYESCLWRTPMRYALQLDILILLQRLAEHFTSSALAIRPTRPFDAVRIVVPACIAAIADSVIRRRATDVPSDFSIALMETRSGLSTSQFAAQSEVIEVHTPELNIARTSVLDYFHGLALDNHILTWENGNGFQAETNQLFAHMAQKLGFPLGGLEAYMTGEGNWHWLIIKNYPEFVCYRDISYFFKLFLNPDPESFPPTAMYKQIDFQLHFQMDPMSPSYIVNSRAGKLSCIPTRKVPPGIQRWYTRTLAQSYVTATGIVANNEDDILHIKTLPDFDGCVGQADAEQLLSFLTVPYLRIPLTLGFFATEDRIHALRSDKVQQLLESCLFEPGKYLPLGYKNVPEYVPTPDKTQLASPYGLLINELVYSPEYVLTTTTTLVKLALNLDTGTVFSSTVPIILFVIRTAARIENYASMILNYAQDTHESLHKSSLRDISITPETVEILEKHLRPLQALLRTHAHRLLDMWQVEVYNRIREAMIKRAEEAKAQAQASKPRLNDVISGQASSFPTSIDHQTRSKGRIFRNQKPKAAQEVDMSMPLDSDDEQEDKLKILSKTGEGMDPVDQCHIIACNLHAHSLLFYRNVRECDLDFESASTLLCGSMYLTIHHSWNMDKLTIPENQIFELLHITRVKLIKYVRSLNQEDLNALMDTLLTVSVGSELRNPRGLNYIRNEQLAEATALGQASVRGTGRKWGYVFGPRSIGRFGVCSKPMHLARKKFVSKIAARSGATPIEEIQDTATMGIDVDVQAVQITLQAAHLKSLPTEIAVDPDVVDIFGMHVMQAATIEDTQHREWLRLVGRGYDLHYWKTPDPRMEPQLLDREYDPSELDQSEVWIYRLFEPVRSMFFMFPEPYPVVMQDKRIPDDASVALLTVLHPKTFGVLFEVYVYRDLQMVTMYSIHSHGRLFYRTLVFTTNAYQTFADMQPSFSDRSQLWQKWNRHMAGGPTNIGEMYPTQVVITRDADVPENLSGGIETYIPARLLCGVIPQALTDAYRFWQDTNDNLRGYPKDPNCPHVIFVQLSQRDCLIDSKNPGTMARITRLLRTTMEEALEAKRQEAEKKYEEELARMEQNPAESEALARRYLARTLSSSSSDVGGQRRASESAELKGEGEGEAKKGDQTIAADATPVYSPLNSESAASVPFNPNPDELPPLTEAELTLVRTRSAEVAATRVLSMSAAAALEASSHALPSTMPSLKRGASVVSETQTDRKTLDEEVLELVNLMTAPKGSALFGIAETLQKIENFSYILPWKRYSANPEQDTQPEELELVLIDLPRLKLSFHTRYDETGTMRLYSMDHTNLYVSNERSPLIMELVKGIPHALLLENSNKELHILVPGVLPVRPNIASSPFSTELVLLRTYTDWLEQLDTRYFLYPVHVSLSFMFTPTLSSALYLLLLRFLNRRYPEVFRIAETIGTDTAFTGEEKMLFEAIQLARSDVHPNACACRMKIAAVTAIDAPDLKLPFDITTVAVSHAHRAKYVSAVCRIQKHEELAILGQCILSEDDPRFDDRIHDLPMVIDAHNRHAVLGALLRQNSKRVATSTRVRVRLIPRVMIATAPRASLAAAVASALETGMPEEYFNLVPEELASLENPAPLKTTHQQRLAGLKTTGYAAIGAFNYVLGRHEDVAGAACAHGFIYAYACFTGEASFRCISGERNSSATYGRFLCKNLMGVEGTVLAAILDLLFHRPEIGSKLPKWDTNKPARSSRNAGNWPGDVSAFVKLILEEIQKLATTEPESLVIPEPPFVPVPEPKQYVEPRDDGERDWILPTLSDYGCERRYAGLITPDLRARAEKALGEGALSPDVFAILFSSPLDPIDIEKFVGYSTLSERGLSELPTDLSFDITHHPDTTSAVAIAMHKRIAHDVALYAESQNQGKFPHTLRVSDKDAKRYLQSHSIVGTNKILDAPSIDEDDGKPTLKDAIALTETLIQKLVELSEHDRNVVTQAIDFIRAVANKVDLPNDDEKDAKESSDDSMARLQFVLYRIAGKEATLWTEYVVGALLSSRAVYDLQKLNPYFERSDIELAFCVIEVLLLRANRVGQVNRALNDARDLLRLLKRTESRTHFDAPDPALLAGLVQTSESLARNLTAERHYGRRVVLDGPLFDMSKDKIHIAGRLPVEIIERAKRSTLADEILSDEAVFPDDTEDQLPRYVSVLERAERIGAYGLQTETRNGSYTGRAGDVCFEYDPRFLVFEFTWNILLRKSQVHMVHDFVDCIRNGRSRVKQMIMGAGKTTVVAPLLTLILGNGKQLILEVVPPALLEFSRSIMRSTFSSIMYKRIYTLHFDRSSLPDGSLYNKLRAAISNSGVVVSTPTSVKSVLLKFLELEQILSDVSIPRPREYEAARDQLARILRLFKQGVLLMDEVDLILHPLKSELNFPVGAKFELDFQPLRWKMAIHILDGLFYMERPRVSLTFRDSHRAVAILRELAAVMRQGINERHIQNSPHPILLNPDFYHDAIKPVMADWLMLWIEAQHITEIPFDEMKRYILNGPLREKEIAAKVDELLPAKHRKMLNLAADWLKSYLPHVFEKIDRVSFGLLSPLDLKLALARDPRMPPSRAKLVVPFVGKDVPSQSSEFAHPDVIIGLTVLAYRYEGLRFSDFTDLIENLRATMTKEAGPYPLRQSCIRYTKWVEEAGGRIKGRSDFTTEVEEKKSTDESKGEDTDAKVDGDVEKGSLDEEEIVEVVPLHLLKRSNKDQMKKLYKLLRMEPEVIHWYLNEFIFPAYMLHQKTKLSAAGTELGGEMLFSRRVGFSGTPSDLLPLELGHCDYERGSDGQMLSVLTSPEVVGYTVMPENWDVKSLLDHIATAKTSYGAPRYHALIDTGALVTGMTNLQVAEYLLDHGLEWAEGVVFLDEEDRKMILVRATRRVVKLAQCGIAKDRRFAFYDQVHTTGMDIQHRLDACAALTLGKDMVFRDYSQGAYRMRGIGKGQTIHLLIIPEIERLIDRELSRCVPNDIDLSNKLLRQKYEFALDKSRVLERVTAWLIINSMQSERVQFNQLCLQNISNIWRKNAFETVIKDYKYFSIDNFPDPDDAQAVARVQAQGGYNPRMIKALHIFLEPIDFAIEDKVPVPKLFSESIGERVKQNDEFIYTDEERGVIKQIIDTVSTTTFDNTIAVLTAEMVQEMEEEKEKQQEQEQEQEIEIEKYVDLAYSREEEEQQPWPAVSLATGGTPDQPDAPIRKLFYSSKEFKLYQRMPLQLSDHVMISNNYFNKKWGGPRRIKNIIMVLDWIPSISQTTTRFDLETAVKAGGFAPEDLESHSRQAALEGAKSRDGDQAFSKAFDLYDLDASGGLNELELSHMLRAITDTNQTPEIVRTYLQLAAGGRGEMDKETLKRLFDAGALRKEENGRWVVILSLSEAETLRRLMHARLGKPFIEGKDTALALRCSSHGNVVFDRTQGWKPAPERQTLEAWQIARFMNNEMHFTNEQIAALMSILEAHTPRERMRYFEQILECRRRMQKKWTDTPVNKLFSLPTFAHLVKQRAQSWRMRTAIRQRNMLYYDAFLAFDANHNGLLAADELYGALEWLGVPNLTPGDVLDFIVTEDSHQDGNLRYKDFLELIKDPDADEDAAESEESSEYAKQDLPVITPKATEELAALLAERRAKLVQEEDEEAKRNEAERRKYLRGLLHEDVEKNRKREGGPNPKLCVYDEVTDILEYDFTKGYDPIHVAKGGDQTFSKDTLLHKYTLFPKASLTVAAPTAAANISDRLDIMREMAFVGSTEENKISINDTLNQYTVIMYVKADIHSKRQALEPLLSFRRSGGGAVYIDRTKQAVVLEGETPTEKKEPSLPNNKWCYVTLTADLGTTPMVRLSVVGVTGLRAPDEQDTEQEAIYFPTLENGPRFTLQGLLELCSHGSKVSTAETYIRKVLIIPHALTPLQIRNVIGALKRSVAWACDTCTSRNDPDAIKCDACGSHRLAKRACPVCTYENPGNLTECAMCSSPLAATDVPGVTPDIAHTYEDHEGAEDEDEELLAAMRASLEY